MATEVNMMKEGKEVGDEVAVAVEMRAQIEVEREAAAKVPPGTAARAEARVPRAADRVAAKVAVRAVAWDYLIDGPAFGYTSQVRAAPWVARMPGWNVVRSR